MAFRSVPEVAMTVREFRTRLFEIEDQDAEASPDLIRQFLSEATPPLKEVRGRVVGVVEVGLYEMVDRDPDAFLLDLSRRLAVHEDLIDLDYPCVGSRGNTLFLEVSGVDEVAATRTRESEVARVARSVLGIESLADQGSDSLDFVELGKSAIREALAVAYEAGKAAAGER
jgi:hypothetical protein